MEESEYLAKPPVLPDRVTYGERMDAAAKEEASINYGLADDSLGAFMFQQRAKGNWSQDDLNEALDSHAEAMESLTIGMPTAGASVAADVTAFATSILYNTYGLTQGTSWAWPEDMRNVPATSEYWGAKLGLTKEQTDSLAFIGGGLVIAPTRALDNLDSKMVSKAIKASKALGGGKRAVAVQRRQTAMDLHKAGTDPDEIWVKTGWWPHQQADGSVEFKFFVSDADARYIPNAGVQRAEQAARMIGADTLQQGDMIQVPLRMGEVLDHPALYQMYPELEGYPVSVMMQKTADGWKIPENTGGQLGSWDPQMRKFTLDSHRGGHYTAATPEDAANYSARQTLLHEAQHAIQTLEGWDDGANAAAMAESVAIYKAGRIMSDAYAQPDIFKNKDPQDIIDMLKAAGFDEQEAKVFHKEIQQLTDGILSPEEIAQQTAAWNGIMQGGLAKTERWLATAVHMGDDKMAFLDSLSPADVGVLSWMRYQLSLGEMESRLTEALSDLTHVDVNAMGLNPHTLMDIMQGTASFRMLKSMFPRIKRMEMAAPIKDAITEKSVGVLQDHGIIDVQNLGPSASAVDQMTPQMLGETLQKLVDTDPELGLKVLKELPAYDVEDYDNLLAKAGEGGSPRQSTVEGPSGFKIITPDSFDENKYYWERMRYWRETGEPLEDAGKFASDDVELVKANMKATERFTTGVNRITIENNLHGSAGSQEIEFLKNPTETSLRRWAAKSLQEDDGYKAVRVVTDVQGNLYVWDANAALHNDFIKATGLKINIDDEWTDVDGVEPEDFAQIFGELKGDTGIDLALPPDRAVPMSPEYGELNKLWDKLSDLEDTNGPIADMLEVEDEIWDLIKNNPKVADEAFEVDKLTFEIKEVGNQEILTLPDGTEITREVVY